MAAIAARGGEQALLPALPFQNLKVEKRSFFLQRYGGHNPVQKKWFQGVLLIALCCQIGLDKSSFITKHDG